MTCDKAQRWILLRETGELSPSRIRKLDEHVTTCAQCRAFGESERRMVDRARSELPSEGPCADAMARILRNAASTDRLPGRTVIFRRRVAFVASCAAAFLAVVAGFWILYCTGNGRLERIDRAKILVAILSSEAIEFPDNGESSGNHEQELRELGRQLLKVEGFYVDQFDSSELYETTAIPTDPRTSSMPSLPEERCV